MEDGLGADVSNSQTVRVRPLSRQGIQDYGLRTCRDPTRKIRMKLGGITVLPSLYTGMEAFFITTRIQALYIVYSTQEEFIMSNKYRFETLQ